MIDFSTLQALDIPEGKVVKIEDAAGRVIWAAQSGGESSGAVILEVEKITSDTYAGETTYTGEQFILLDIYPKTNGTVSVTYGGLTKTITDTSGAEKPNAQQVYFGTFNGVSDDVETPASGTLTIEGDYLSFGISSFKSSGDSKATDQYRAFITEVVDLGAITMIPSSAFYGCTGITLSELPSGITTIGMSAFYGCTGITLSELPSGITTVALSAFRGCTGLTHLTLHSGITKIELQAFMGCTGLRNVTLLATTPPTLGGLNAFGDTTCTFTVPKGCSDVYKAAEYWSEYADRIVEAS